MRVSHERHAWGEALQIHQALGVSMRRTLSLVSLAAIVMLAGCATVNHNQAASNVNLAAQSGNIDGALSALDQSYSSEGDKKELLYLMERGELLRLAKRYEDSNSALLSADNIVKQWEEDSKAGAKRLGGNIGAALLSEKFKAYEGQDYEKVMLTLRLALNRMALGDWDNARADIKRTHEREATIAEVRSKDYADAEDEAKKNGANVQSKELNGYPTETLNDPAVKALKNGYQNALGHYLSAFAYEALNEPSMAAPGYRKAIELFPNQSLLEDGLKGLDARTSYSNKRKQQKTDVLFVIETGAAPARTAKGFPLPVPTGGGRMVVANISIPVVQPTQSPPISNLQVGDQSLLTQPIVDFNLMARRALKDDMPGMILRGTTRAIAKGIAQDQAQKHFGAVGGILAAVATVATEQPEDRIWRSLPERIYIARGYVTPGDYEVRLNNWPEPVKVSVKGQYAVVALRNYLGKSYNTDTASIGKLVAPALAEAKPGNPLPLATPAAASVNKKPMAKPTAAAVTSTATKK
jgi:hypothetical protein